MKPPLKSSRLQSRVGPKKLQIHASWNHPSAMSELDAEVILLIVQETSIFTTCDVNKKCCKSTRQNYEPQVVEDLFHQQSGCLFLHFSTSNAQWCYGGVAGIWRHCCKTATLCWNTMRCNTTHCNMTSFVVNGFMSKLGSCTWYSYFQAKWNEQKQNCETTCASWEHGR